ncbi:MAG TPA: nucleoside hydrolase, partial [Jatrophihabitans sp.]|nr:nucleoside hydrolase [Jatrophihabitans sp.]
GTAGLGAAAAEAATSAQQFRPPGGPSFRVVSDNDYSGDPDRLYQLAHLLLSPSVDVRAVIGSHLAPGDPFDPSTEQATNAYRRAVEVLRLLGLGHRVAAYAGSNTALADRHTPHRSAGAVAIVREAMRSDTTLPLFATFGAGLTELASAYLIEPRIADRLTAVWIGGPEYPDLATPPPGASGIEYNLNIDVTAAQVVFNDSSIPIWQVPRNVYRQCLVSMTELLHEVRPAGRIGAYLYRHVVDIFELAAGVGLSLGETYILGDSPLVLLTALQSSFQPDPSSSRYVTRYAPRITDDGGYTPRTSGRQIRVYTDLDVRLMFSDLFTKLRSGRVDASVAASK